jgi:hypothetical protein
MAPFSLTFEVKAADGRPFSNETRTYGQIAQLMPEMDNRHAGGMSKAKALSKAIVNVPHNTIGQENINFPDKEFVFDLPILIPLRDSQEAASTIIQNQYPHEIYHWLEGLYPLSWKQEQARKAAQGTQSPGSVSPLLVLRNSKPDQISRPDVSTSQKIYSTSRHDRYSHLSIVVSHSKHTLKLVAHSFFGNEQILYACRVGLGARDFPTPKGVYYVTHIYDEDPLWIPPKNRPWAWGQRPSSRVYGGTMAPLLKKRFVRSRRSRHSRRHKKRFFDDYIAGKVQLNDYDYRFHGTNQPRSIGRNQSHGCVRMLPKDAKALANLIKEYVGTRMRDQSENGTFVVLNAPVRLTIVQ